MKPTYVTICTPANDLDTSKEFYKKLNFEIISEAKPTLLADTNFIIEIVDDTYARPGLKLYKVDWTEELSKLREMTEVIEYDDGFLASDPNGVKAYLSTENFEEYAKPKDLIGMTGNFAGISLEAVDVKGTCDFWACLGYEKNYGEFEQGWVTYTNGSDVVISIMKMQTCPHMFFNPGMTFFNSGDNPRIIQEIRDAGIPITEEITAFNPEGNVDNIIIKDPGGYGFFIFND